jgi:hypothetical protein
MFENFQEIERWQIVQLSLTEIDFIIRTDQISSERINALEMEIYRRLNHSVKVNIHVNGVFIQKNEGKINSFLSLLNK